MSDIYEVVDVVQGSKEWLEWRKTGVTATCSPILLEEPGATKTPYELYLQYAGLIQAEDLSVIKQVDAGKKLEVLARSYCEKEIGQIALPFCVRNKKYPYMIASLDGQFDDGSILEIKNLCESKHLSILELETKSPEFRYYYWQVQHQLLTTGAPQAFLVFWSATDQTKVFKIMPSDKAFYRIQVACEYFWNKVQTKTALPFDKEKDILLISDPEIMSQTQGFKLPDDLEARVVDIARQVGTLQLMEKELALKKKQFEEYQNAVNLLIQGLGASIGFSYNELVRIDGFGFRFLQSRVPEKPSYKRICDKLSIDPKHHPECYGQSSVRNSLSTYEYKSTLTDTVYIPLDDTSVLVSPGAEETDSAQQYVVF